MDDLRQQVIDYILNDTVTKERFSDIEICNEDDNYTANEEVFAIVSSYSDEDCINFLDAMDNGAEIVAGGWIDSEGNYQPSSVYASNTIKFRTIGVTASDETAMTGVDYYLDRIADGISWALDVSTQTALDLIHAMQLDEDDLEDMGFSREEYPEFYN